MSILFRLLLAMTAGFGVAACAGSAPGPDAFDAGDAGRSSHSSGTSYRDQSMRLIGSMPARVSVEHDPRLGSAAAKIGIIGFSDYQCLYCREFHRDQFARLRKEYIVTGVVQFIHKDLPLPRHAQAVPAALAAHCAGAQGRFWDMHDALFAGQGRLGPNLYAELVHQLQLDAAKFDDCMKSRAPGDHIARNAGMARRLGFDGTPSFLIGTVAGDVFTVKQQLRGVPDFERLAREIGKLR